MSGQCNNQLIYYRCSKLISKNQAQKKDAPGVLFLLEDSSDALTHVVFSSRSTTKEVDYSERAKSSTDETSVWAVCCRQSVYGIYDAFDLAAAVYVRVCCR